MCLYENHPADLVNHGKLVDDSTQKNARLALRQYAPQNCVHDAPAQDQPEGERHPDVVFLN